MNSINNPKITLPLQYILGSQCDPKGRTEEASLRILLYIQHGEARAKDASEANIRVLYIICILMPAIYVFLNKEHK